MCYLSVSSFASFLLRYIELSGPLRFCLIIEFSHCSQFRAAITADRYECHVSYTAFAETAQRRDLSLDTDVLKDAVFHTVSPPYIYEAL